MSKEHEWFEVVFNYGGHIECECGFLPGSEEDMDAHTAEWGMR
ncbi:hypothetical protein GCM10023351_18430 [Microbacterium gilvum]|uniref:Uncharacterized protein n=1 Tax=Microbacterium gilvum TaxID=1336204 RepID=A0ABP9A549_9MICO